MSSTTTRWSRESGRPRPTRPPLGGVGRGTQHLARRWTPRSPAVPWSTRSPGRAPRCVATTSPPRSSSTRRTSGTPPAPRPCRSGRCTRSTATSWCRSRASRCCGSTARRLPSSCRRTPGSRRGRRRAGRSSAPATGPPTALRCSPRTWPTCCATGASRVSASASTGSTPTGSWLCRRPGCTSYRRSWPSSRRGRSRVPEEIELIRRSLAVADAAVADLYQALRPGMTENEAWGLLLGQAFALGAEFSECRLLSSGPRTNPWFREASDRPMEARRPGGVRHRPHRPGRLPGRSLPHLPRRLHDAVRPAAAGSTPTPRRSSPTSSPS